MSDNLITIIIPVYNNWDLVKQCLISIAKDTAELASSDLNIGEIKPKIILVDDASPDIAGMKESGLLGTKLFGDRFQCFRLERNCGFATSCNYGARQADTEFICFLNSDTIVTKGWLAPLLQAFKDVPNLGAVSPLLLYSDATIQHLGVAVYPNTTIQHIYHNLPASHRSTNYNLRYFRLLTAAALVMPKNIFIAQGQFDTAFRNGFEDVDLCLRLQNYKLACVPQARVIHLESKSPERTQYEIENGKILRSKWDFSNFIDAQVILAQDGYKIHILPQLDFRIQPLDAKILEYTQKLEHFRPEICQEILTAEPYWFQGYVLFANWLSQHGRLEDALNVFCQALNLFDCLEPNEYLPIISIMQKLNLDSSQLEKIRQDNIATIANTTAWNTELDYIKNNLQKIGDPYCQELLKDCQILENGIKMYSSLL